jgi:hypothetical protein
MAFRYLIYSTGTTFAETIVRESATDNPGVNEASYYSDFVIPAIQPLYLWRVTGGTGSEEVVPNTDSNIVNYLESIAPPPSAEDDATVGYVTGLTSQKIDRVTGATNEVPVFISNGNLDSSGYTIDQLTGATALDIVGSGNTQVTESGDTFIIYSETSWGDITGTLSNQIDLQNALNAKVDNTTFNSYTGVTDIRLNDIENNITTLSGETANKLDESIFNTYTGNTQPIIDGALTGLTNLGTGTTLGNTSGRNVTVKSISVLGGLSLVGDSNNLIISGITDTGAVWGNITGTLSNQTDLQNALNAKLDESDFNFYTGSTDTRLNNIENDITYLSGQTDLRLLTSDFNSYTASTENRFQEIEIDIDELSGVTEVALTGATNGISTSGRNVTLGGALNQDTTISGTSYDLFINVSDITLQSTGNIDILDTNGNTIDIETDGGSIDIVGNTGLGAEQTKISVTPTQLLITDSRSTARGLEYNADYSGDYTSRSLVDKAYVDNVASGLIPKASVDATTITNIDLTGGTFGGTVDGYTVQDGDRILVKEQTDASENGIYVYSSSGNDFSRSSDFDGTPDGEVSDGNIIPVVSGNTLYNTIWILVTPNPITIGTTSLEFTLFSRPHELIGGTGITVNANIISVDGASLAGNSILWSASTFNVDPTSGTLATELGTKLNISDFNSYTGSTDSRLDDIENDITYISGITDTKVNNDTFTGYTATTDSRLDDIENDITYISGITDNNYNEFTGYTATTDSRLDDIEGDITGLSATTDTKLDQAVFTGYTASTAPNEIHLIHTGGTSLNTITTTGIEWDSVQVSGDSYSWTGGTDIFIQEAGDYEISYNIPYVSGNNNRKIGIGSNLILNNNTVIDNSASGAQVSDNGIIASLILPPVILSLSQNDKLTLGVFRTGNAGTATSEENGNILIKKKETLQ